MDFDLTDEQQMLRATLDRYVKDAQGQARRNVGKTADSVSSRRKSWRSLADLGVFTLAFSAAAGDLVDISQVMEALGAGCASTPYVSCLLLAGRLVAALGSAAQQQSILPSVVSGSTILALAQAEPGARFELDNAKTVAVRSSDGYIISGKKTLVLDGADADLFVVIATTHTPSAPHGNLSAFLVDATARGVSRFAYELSDGSVACELALETVSVGSDALLGGEGAAFEALESVVRDASVALCSEAVGIAAAAINVTVEHLRTRKQFGSPLAKFQAVQHRMADCYLKLELARSITLKALLGKPRADRLAWLREACAAKAFVSEAALHIVHEAVQFHGAMGLTDELVIGSYLKRLNVISMLFGDTRAQIDRYNNYLVDEK
jgi:alkylation response protein AidB-like acyl-CoA dehydrogenase